MAHLLCRLLAFALAAGFALGHQHSARASLQNVLSHPLRTINNVLPSVREHWMREANAAMAELVSPCPFGAFASVIVNHTASASGELVCVGANAVRSTGNPIMHGEIAAIQNCTAIFTDPHGPYNYTASQAQAAFADLSLYTNAESCPMCASAIRWAGFREYIYGSSIEELIAQGWGQIRVSSMEIFQESFDLPNVARLIGGVLTEETDPLFSWQYNADFPCPKGCARVSGSCSPVQK
ncbi:cytidine deaminase-like protein [Trametes maxima]|nr:cytidine deaminase-like protein [Trametes maxima]